ncbi:Protein AmpG [Gossypium arboreum]|uniref:Protein AmpG n=1 Tax=Gossypium arboreum TaxID=29729 RepID=A0A0B0PPE8_GOSAR|nr:Protein AmpG [Gossypium arboreum]
MDIEQILVVSYELGDRYRSHPHYRQFSIVEASSDSGIVGVCHHTIDHLVSTFGALYIWCA